MKRPVPVESASAFIDEKIKELGDWRGKTLAKVREIIHEADPEILEEWKWMGTPIWSHGGIVCTGETYKNVVKMTFPKGAALQDPSGLLNSSLDGNVRRAIDIHEGWSDEPDEVTAARERAIPRFAECLQTAVTAKSPAGKNLPSVFENCGEGGIRTLRPPWRCVSYGFLVAGSARTARAAVAHCPPLPPTDAALQLLLTRDCRLENQLFRRAWPHRGAPSEMTPFSDRRNASDLAKGRGLECAVVTRYDPHRAHPAGARRRRAASIAISNAVVLPSSKHTAAGPGSNRGADG